MTNNDIAIKWPGSKRSQASAILTHFPKEMDTYYEPFCGGASVFFELAHSEIRCKRYILSDINNDLISLWKTIQSNPKRLSESYRELWSELNADSDIARKVSYYNSVRNRFNHTRKPEDFLFLMRTCANGMPRYNSRNEFNTPFHLTRNGIKPDTLSDILNRWNNILNSNDVEFRCCGYCEITPSKDDFAYFDPPYANTKGMYFGGIGLSDFFSYICDIPCGWALSFDGISGNVDNTFDVPNGLYDEHLYIKSGNSSFKRLIGTDRNATVLESLYIKH